MCKHHHRLFVFLLAAALLCALAGPARAQGPAPTPRQIAARAFPSVALLVMYGPDGKALRIGSGFVAARGILVTNYHVVQASHSGVVRFVGQSRKYAIRGVVGFDVWADLALVKIDDTSHQPLPLGLSRQVAVGDRLFAVGNPQGLVGTFSEGLLSAVRKFPNGQDYLFQISTPISKGSSGGPVLNQQGQVVAVTVSMMSSGQNLNFAVPCHYLRNLLANQTPLRRLKDLPRVLYSRAERRRPDSSSGAQAKRPELVMGPGVDGVSLQNFLWSEPPLTRYSFSIKNSLPYALAGVVLHAVYYDQQGEVLDNQRWKHKAEIYPGMAVRSSRQMDQEVYQLCSRVRLSVVGVQRPSR